MTASELVELLDGVNQSYIIKIKTPQGLVDIAEEYITDTTTKQIILETPIEQPNPYKDIGTAWTSTFETIA